MDRYRITVETDVSPGVERKYIDELAMRLGLQVSIGQVVYISTELIDKAKFQVKD